MRWGRQVLSLFLLVAGPVLMLAAPIPEVGSQAPEFALQSQNGNVVRLSDYRGKWVVLYFYPFPGRCPLEAVNFERDRAAYQKKNTVVLGISVDTVGSQKNCVRETAHFKILSDPSGDVTLKYGSLTKVIFFRIGSRNTFVIDPEGRISRVFSDVMLPAQQSHEVLTALTKLQQAWSVSQ